MKTRVLKNKPNDTNFILDDYTLYNLNRTSATYTAKMSAVLKPLSIDQPGWRILMILGDKNPSTVSELARRSATMLSTITRMVIRMEDSGFLNRSICPQDNRVTQVHITDKGQHMLDSLRGIATRIYERSLDGLSQAQIDQFTKTLKHIRANLTDEPNY
jgi:MarR family transcriptional regulator, organic hydroperoxide resistance regulator